MKEATLQKRNSEEGRGCSKTSEATNLSVKNAEGRDVLLGDLLSSELDNTHKEVIKDLKKDNEIKKAKMS